MKDLETAKSIQEGSIYRMVKIMKENLQLKIKNYMKCLMLMGIVIGFSSCQDKDQFTPDPISGDVSEFYADVQDAFGGDSFDAATAHVYITNNNTSVHIPANSLVYADGSDVIGDVIVSLEDVLNKGELIVHNVPTMSSEKALSSEGALFVSFVQNNEELSIKPGSLITIRITDPNADADAELYDGLDKETAANWELSQETMALESWNFFWDGKDWIDSGYEFYITRTGWFTVALKLEPATAFEAPICVSLPAELYDGTNTDVFLILDDYDTVLPLELNSEKMLFCATFSNIPQDSEVIIVSVSSLGDGNYHYGTSNATISIDNGGLFVFPESQTKAEILDLLGMF